jgi:hypothetical protein
MRYALWAGGRGLELRAAGHAFSLMPARETRRELNQPRFREANERLHEDVESEGQETQAVSLLCECADDDCPGTVNVSLGEWEAVVSRNNHFLMEAGHQHSEGEEVVGSLGNYEIARKPD